MLENYTLEFLVLGLIASAVSLGRKPRPWTKGVVVEALFSYFLLFAVGALFFYNFVVHVFFGDMTARFIGWEQSPFQAEVGTASLGYAVVGLLAFRGSLGLRLAAVVGPSLFMLGAAAGHIYQMIVAENFAPGNAGVIFYTDIAIPILGGILLWLQYTCRRAEQQSGAKDTAPAASYPQPHTGGGT
jgi:hypothetical protein